MPDEGIYMTTTKDPWGEWSKPVNIRPGAGWIDPWSILGCVEKLILMQVLQRAVIV